MLYALRHPLALLVLVVAFVLGVTVRGMVQSWLGARLGDRSGVAAGRRSLDPRRHLDPFGAVAAAIGGVGWGRPWERPYAVGRRGRGRAAAVLVAGPVVLAALGAVLIALYLLAGGPPLLLDAQVTALVHGAVVPANAGYTALLLAGVELVAMAVLDIVPLPPLDGGRLLFLLGPRSVGWQKAEYHLAEQNWGVGILLVLLLLPLAGGAPLLLVVIDAIAGPLLALGAR